MQKDSFLITRLICDVRLLCFAYASFSLNEAHFYSIMIICLLFVFLLCYSFDVTLHFTEQNIVLSVYETIFSIYLFIDSVIYMSHIMRKAVSGVPTQTMLYSHRRWLEA